MLVPEAERALDTRHATLIGFGAIILWGLLAVLTTASGEIPPFQLAAMTFTIGGGLGLIVTIARGKLSALKQSWQAWALGVGGLFGYHALYFAALQLSPPAQANLINYLWPLQIVLFSAFLPGERLRSQHFIGALLGLAGVVVLGFGNGKLGFQLEHLAGYGLAILSGLVWASYSVLSRRFGEVPTDAVTGFCLATSALATLCHGLFETTVVPSSTLAWLAILASGLGPVGAAFYLWDIGVKRGNIRLLGVASYATPILSTLGLIVAGYASATPALMIACLLIVTGAVIASR